MTTRDYRGRAETLRGASRAEPRRGVCWGWLLAGVLMGTSGMGLAWLKLDPELTLLRGGEALHASLPEPGKDAPLSPATLARIEFEFPDTLKELQVEVPPDGPVGAPRPPPPPLVATQPMQSPSGTPPPPMAGQPPAVAPQPPLHGQEPTPTPPERVARAEPPKPTPPPERPPRVEPPKPTPPPPERVARAEPPKPAVPERPATTPRESYQLQFSAFPRADDAERLRTQLAGLGISVQVQRIGINQNIYYRVRSSPYHDRQQMDEARRRLRRNNIDSILVRWKE